MRRNLRTPALRLIPVLLLLTCALAAEKPILERIEWSDIWVTNANQDDLPRVLLVGDSITKQYFKTVEQALDGGANCARYATSKFLADPHYLPELELLLRSYRFDVIHINNGLHGFGYTEIQYQAGFPPLLALLKKAAPQARLIWATTTPVRRKGDLTHFNEERTDRVKERNRIAVSFAEQHGIPIDDLYAVVEDHPEYYQSGGTHFKETGVAALGQQAASVIRPLLPVAAAQRTGTASGVAATIANTAFSVSILDSGALEIKIYTNRLNNPYYRSGSEPVLNNYSRVNTTFAQVAEIAAGLKAMGIDKSLILLDGWNRAGYDRERVDLWPPAAGVGGAKRLVRAAARTRS